MAILLVEGNGDDLGWLWDELDSRQYLHEFEVDCVKWNSQDLLKACRDVTDRPSEVERAMWQEGLVFEDLDEPWRKLAQKFHAMLIADAERMQVALGEVKET